MATVQRPRREVLAFYYRGRANPQFSRAYKRWQGLNKEAPKEDPVPHLPLLGMYDSLDPAVITQHAAWLKQGGFTGAIHGAWYRELWEDRGGGPIWLQAMHDHGLKVSFYLEGQKGGVEGAKNDFRYMFQQAMTHPAWLRVDGRPVIFLYRKALRELPADGWREAARAMVAEGHPEPLLLADVEPADPQFDAKAGMLNGTHIWHFAEHIAGKSPAEITAFTDEAYPRWLANAPKRIRCAMVMPGYDDRLIENRPYPRPTTDRFGTGTLGALWSAAIRHDVDFVIVNSFNAAHNGNEMEPSVDWGTSAIDANAIFARRFLSGSRV
ncbi:hypothetical protein [Sphingomonas bacterium]|uniref:hypothetical protein n=1 Tax=Sphingomonas bacterium TaxID=1895847 RepID=UPI0015764F63|nr:hypothetical protein [Sphingomonas bacterium]